MTRSVYVRVRIGILILKRIPRLLNAPTLIQRRFKGLILRDFFVEEAFSDEVPSSKKYVFSDRGNFLFYKRLNYSHMSSHIIKKRTNLNQLKNLRQRVSKVV